MNCVRHKHHQWWLALLIPVLLLCYQPATPEPVRVGHVRAELVSDVSSIVPGQSFRAGLRLQMDDEWHVYWRNPGDAGIPPKIDWALPPGFTAAGIQWPYPERFEVPPLTSFGYHHDVLLPVVVTPPDDLQPGSTVTLDATAEWLVCRVKCIPGEADVSLQLRVSDDVAEPNDKWVEAFDNVHSKLPLNSDAWQIAAKQDGRSLELTIASPDGFTGSLDSVYFFPEKKNLVDHTAEQRLTRTERGYRLNVTLSQYALEVPDTLTGVLVSRTGWRGPGSEKALAVDVEIGDQRAAADKASTATVSPDGGITLWQALLFAFLGGIILNLMPCVLPVLSLKVMGFVQQSQDGRGVAFRHGLFFMLGVLISFWILSGALLILQAGGQELGWGFQLQSPTFLIILSAFMFLFGLNLLGVFEVGTSLTGLGAETVGRSGYTGSFVAGITATVVATPCTAPFMGTALGYSLTQPALISISIFTALALGMAAPYVVLSGSPGLLKYVPRPGRWMETLKQILGFLLIGTVIWLVWVLGVQTGIIGVVTLLATLLLIAIGAWTYGRFGTLGASTRGRLLAYTIAAVFVFGGIVFGLTSVHGTDGGGTRPVAGNGDGLDWKPFSPQRVEKALESGTPVFIDFTAAWCLSCQVNERVALEAPQVRQKFKKFGVLPLKADWTSRDETITRTLAKFGRNSVPLYVLYRSKDAKPIVLPEILTPGIVLQALKRIEG